MVDSTDVPRIEEVKATLEEVVKDEGTEGVPVLVLANKQDRDESLEITALKDVIMPVLVKLGARDSRVLPISALEGYVICHLLDELLLTTLIESELRRL